MEIKSREERERVSAFETGIEFDWKGMEIEGTLGDKGNKGNKGNKE